MLSRRDLPPDWPLPGRSVNALAAVAFLALFAVPMLAPVLAAASDPAAWSALRNDLPRLLALAGRTVALAGVVALLAVPWGVAAAYALFRLRWPGVRLAAAAWLVAALLPLALYAGAWQACVGPYGFVRLASPGLPTLGGFLPAALVHAAFALPLVVGAAAFALRTVDPAAEDAARCEGPVATAFRAAAWPALRPALPTLAVLAATPVFADMAVTDLFQCRTLAEEVYTELNHRAVGGERPLVLALLPLAGAAAWLLARGLARLLPATVRPAAARRLECDRSAWPFLLATALTMLAAAIPLAGLLRQLGLSGGTPETVRWSAATAGNYLLETGRRHGGFLLRELLAEALLASAVTAAAAVLAWRWRWSGPRGQAWGWFAAAWALLLPGPAVAMGLLDLFQASWLPAPLAAWRLTALPMHWAEAARALPWAFLVLAAAWRRTDRATHEAAWLDGAGGWRQFAGLALPAARGPLFVAWLVAFAAIWQELSSSKLLAPAGTDKLVRRLFDLLHNGTANEQAALCLLAAAVSAALAAGLAAAGSAGRR